MNSSSRVERGGCLRVSILRLSARRAIAIIAESLAPEPGLALASCSVLCSRSNEAFVVVHAIAIVA